MAPRLHGALPARLNVLAAFAIAGLLLGLPAALVLARAAGGGPATFVALANDATMLAAVRLTVGITLGTLLLNTALGAFVGWTIAMYRFPGKVIMRVRSSICRSRSPPGGSPDWASYS